MSGGSKTVAWTEKFELVAGRLGQLEASAEAAEKLAMERHQQLLGAVAGLQDGLEREFKHRDDRIDGLHDRIVQTENDLRPTMQDRKKTLWQVTAVVLSGLGLMVTVGGFLVSRMTDGVERDVRQVRESVSVVSRSLKELAKKTSDQGSAYERRFVDLEKQVLTIEGKVGTLTVRVLSAEGARQ